MSFSEKSMLYIHCVRSLHKGNNNNDNNNNNNNNNNIGNNNNDDDDDDDDDDDNRNAMAIAESLRDVFVARGLKKVEKRSKWHFSYGKNPK